MKSAEEIRNAVEKRYAEIARAEATMNAQAIRHWRWAPGPWTVLAASCFILLITMGWRYSFGVFFKSMAGEFGWDRATLSLVVAINMLVFGLSQPFVGQLADRLGPRRVLAICSIVLGTGLAAVSVSQTFLGIVVFYGIAVGLGFGATTITVNSALISRWFDRNRGLALGIASAGVSAGQAVFIPLTTTVLIASGWRQGFLMLGALTVILLLLVVGVVVRDQPPGGAATPAGRGQALARQDVRPLAAMRTAAFWQLGGAFLTCGFAISLMSTHFIPYATDVGLSPQLAGRLFGFMGVMSILGSLSAGWLSDQIGRRLPLASVYLLRVVAFLLLSRAQTPGDFWLCVTLFGLCWAAPFPLTSAFTGDLWGKGAIATIFGTIFFLHLLGDALGAYVGGLLFDRTGSYTLVFMLAAVLAGLAGLSVLSIRWRPEKEEAFTAEGAPALVAIESPRQWRDTL
ncbi:MAG: MFS transporter [Candidatus Rokubacteria bacterium]|nr:MFS transporter [Candidatus Rokubacteria bacterium]